MMSQPDPEQGLEMLLSVPLDVPLQTACLWMALACVSTGRQKVFVLNPRDQNKDLLVSQQELPMELAPMFGATDGLPLNPSVSLCSLALRFSD